jgi:uncharacterized membrane protein
MKSGEKRPIDPIWMVLAGVTVLLLTTCILCWLKGGNQRMAIPIILYKTMGLAASIFLVLGELGHKIFDRVCIHGDHLDCYAVMNSPAAKLMGRIPMADLGVLYFSGGIILIGFSVVNPYFFDQIFLLSILNLLTLPYTFFSVTYQGFIIKKWCPLCLIVQLTFWLEFFYFFSFLTAGVPRFRVEDFLPLVWSFGLPTLLWLLFRPILKKSIQADKDLTS